MSRNWREIRTETLNLGFEKIKAYDKNKQAYVDAYNWAQGIIASTVGGVLRKIAVGCSGENHKHIFDLEEMAKGEGEEFIAIAQAGVTDIKNNRINGWTLTDNRFFSMPDDFTGHRIINVLVMPKKITTGSADDTLCQLPDRWRNIMPYLMANRLYLDDDAAKAGYYWNLYMDMSNEILASESRLAVAVVGGIDIDGWCY
jgi:hypothetical protein